MKPVKIEDESHILMNKLMPDINQIPKEFKDFMSSNKWAKCFNDWFFKGLILINTLYICTFFLYKQFNNWC
jgi:hypothetical protein